MCLSLCLVSLPPPTPLHPFLKSRASFRKDCEFGGYLGLLKYYPLFLLHQVTTHHTLFIHFLLENVVSISVHCLSLAPCSPHLPRSSPRQCPDFIETKYSELSRKVPMSTVWFSCLSLLLGKLSPSHASSLHIPFSNVTHLTYLLKKLKVLVLRCKSL